MIFASPRRRIFSLIGASTLGVALLSGPFAARNAAASLIPCRSDPAVVLSNGAVLDLQAGVNDNLSDVQTVVYTLHVPTGVHAVLVVPTDGLIGLKEKFVLYSDDTMNTYDAYTRVTTGMSGVSVNTSTVLVSALGLQLGASLANGYSGQNLHTHMAGLLSLGL